MTNETYLGDGLYGSFSGFDFKLRAPRVCPHGCPSGDHWVVLEPLVLKEFLLLVKASHPNLFDAILAGVGYHQREPQEG